MTSPELVTAPNGIVMLREGLDTVVRRRWWSWTAIPLLIFCILWNGFVALWLTVTLAMGARPLALFGLVHAAIGIALVYGVLARFLNVTDVLISADGVRVKTHPVPWRGNLYLSSADLSRLHTREVIRHHKGGTSRTYEVHALDRSGRERILLRGLPAFEQARFVQQTIAQAFGIPE